VIQIHMPVPSSALEALRPVAAVAPGANRPNSMEAASATPTISGASQRPHRLRLIRSTILVLSAYEVS
jgi:hypothetical protein